MLKKCRKSRLIDDISLVTISSLNILMWYHKKPGYLSLHWHTIVIIYYADLEKKKCDAA